MARKEDYIPGNDAEFRTWLAGFATNLTANPEQVGLTPAEVAFLTERRDAFAVALAEHEQQQCVAKSATAAKNSLRAAIEQEVRPLVRRINTHPGASKKVRGLLGLHNPNPHRTRRRVGADVPGLFVETSPGSATVHFGTSPMNEHRNGKPKWASGCVIYRRKEGQHGFRMIAFSTTSPYVDFITEDAVNVTYLVRYQGVRATDLGGHSLEVSVAAGRGSNREAA